MDTLCDQIEHGAGRLLPHGPFVFVRAAEVRK